jgi:3-hydroxybutyrate dehydrogenase
LYIKYCYSIGFGFGLAKRLDSMGFTVFAGCLQENSDGATTLKSSTTGRLHVIKLDVTKDKSVEEAVKFVKKTDLKTHCGILINL